jgi:collagenase-like PrtC family protease
VMNIWPRVRLVISGLLALALVGVVVLKVVARVKDSEDAAACHSLYAQARTAADTALVDRSVPPRARGRDELGAPLALCGVLRRAGRVR